MCHPVLIFYDVEVRDFNMFGGKLLFSRETAPLRYATLPGANATLASLAVASIRLYGGVEHYIKEGIYLKRFSVGVMPRRGWIIWSKLY